MFASRGWMKFALALNLAGTILLFYSFQATSSNLKVVTTKDGLRTALCVDGRGLIVSEPRGGISVGMRSCPEWENAKPAAVVNVERPYLITLGFLLIVFGFVIQYLTVPDVKTMDVLRQELKLQRRIAKAAEKNQR